MANETKIFQGRFTFDGVEELLVLPGGVDWVELVNYSVADAAGAGEVVGGYWQRGMDDDAGIQWIKLGADDSTEIDVTAADGFTEIVTAPVPQLGALNNTVTRVNGALVSLGATAGLQEGGIVRFVNITGAQQLGGIDFEIDTIVPNVSFNLSFAAAVADTGVQVAQTLYPVNVEGQFYPRRRFISAITQAANAVVTLTVSHAYEVGQTVRFLVPAAYGMTQMNNLLGTITAVDNALNTITVDIDSQAFTAFAFPLTAAVPFTPAQVIPVGMDSSEDYVNLLPGELENEGYRGILCRPEVVGLVGDVVYWRAGVSESVDNE